MTANKSPDEELEAILVELIAGKGFIETFKPEIVAVQARLPAIQTATQAINNLYIRRDEVEKAIGENEEWGGKTGVPSNNWLMMQGRNQLRQSIRQALDKEASDG